MRTINLWESNLSSDFSYINNIDDFLKYIKENEVTIIKCAEKFTPGDSVTNLFEGMFTDQNVEVIYTDENHFVSIPTGLFGSIVVHPSFMEKYRNEISSALTENILKSTYSVYFTDLTYSFDLLKKVVENAPYIECNFNNIDLPEDVIEFLKENCIEAYVKKNDERLCVSSEKVLGDLTKKQVSEAIGDVYLKLEEISEIDKEKLKYFKDTTIIVIDNKKYTSEDYDKIEKVLRALDEIGKKTIVKVSIKAREEFKKSKLFDLQLKNVNLIINNDLYDYPIEAYKNEEKRLDSMVEHIKQSSLSSLEKYIAVYNIVKNFKKYNENKSDPKQARNLRFILDNDYMVCVGYARLLKTLLNKVGIECSEFSVGVDISYDEGFTVEDKTVEVAGHARNLVRIDDDKYNIHGIYTADPTWDNNLESDNLNYALTTIDKVSQSKRLFLINPTFLILDVHDFDEFKTQVNFLLKVYYRENLELAIKNFDSNYDKYDKNKVSKYQYKNEMYYEQLMKAYAKVVEKIQEALAIDSKKFDSIHDKYEFNDETDYLSFLTEIGHYIVRQTNQSFDTRILIDANIEGLTKLDIESIEDIDKEKMIRDHLEKESKKFPYMPNDSKVHHYFHITDEEYLENAVGISEEFRSIIKRKINENLININQDEIKLEMEEEGKSLH